MNKLPFSYVFVYMWIVQVTIPLGNIATVHPVTLKENPPEKYIELVTIDGHEFWFMGFVNYEKASHHLFDSVSDFRAFTDAAQAVHANRDVPVSE